MSARILIVDDDLAFRESTAELLRQDGYQVATSDDGNAGAAFLEREEVDLVLLDLKMPGPDGVAITEALRRRGERVAILMISGFGTIDAAVLAMQHGVDDFLSKPVEPSELSRRVEILLARRPRVAGHDAFSRIVGRSHQMSAVFAAIDAVAPTSASVLITGETGTGKELIARAVHERSLRGGPFLAANCAALAPGVMESELFGHVRGAFTGAVQDRPGLFRAAHGGTLFLDEVGDLSQEGQRGLLRVLQEHEVTPVGAVRPVRVDVRVLAATHRDLKAAVGAGNFREDLFYRLAVFPIHVSPLRERRDDIPLLTEVFLQNTSDAGAPSPSISSLAMKLLWSYDWPGNVRELKTALESALIRSRGARIEAQFLPDVIRAPSNDGPERYQAEGYDDEEKTIVSALEAAQGNRSRAAELLGMGRTTLWRKMRQYGLDRSGPDS